MTTYTFALHFNGACIKPIRIQADSEFAAYMQGLDLLAALYPVRHLDCTITPCNDEPVAYRAESEGVLIKMVSYEAGSKIDYVFKQPKIKTF